MLLYSIFLIVKEENARNKTGSTEGRYEFHRQNIEAKWKTHGKWNHKRKLYLASDKKCSNCLGGNV